MSSLSWIDVLANEWSYLSLPPPSGFFKVFEIVPGIVLIKCNCVAAQYLFSISSPYLLRYFPFTQCKLQQTLGNHHVCQCISSGKESSNFTAGIWEVFYLFFFFLLRWAKKNTSKWTGIDWFVRQLSMQCWCQLGGITAESHVTNMCFSLWKSCARMFFFLIEGWKK